MQIRRARKIFFYKLWYNKSSEIMCGRFTIAVNKEEVKEYLYHQFGIEDFQIDYFLPRYNIAPGEKIIAIIGDGKGYRAGLMKWGFIPHFQKSEKSAYKMINARAESIVEKPSFKNAFLKRRCLLLTDGYFEWQKDGKLKRPHRITLKDQKLFTFAGIWNNFTFEDGQKYATCAIITAASGREMRKIHDRIPVIINPEEKATWLNPALNDPLKLSELIKPLPDELFFTYQVSSIVNNPRNDNEECIKPIAVK